MKRYLFLWLACSLTYFWVDAQDVVETGGNVENKIFAENDSVFSVADIQTTGPVVISHSVAVSFTSRTGIWLGPGFSTEAGALFSAFVKGVAARPVDSVTAHSTDILQNDYLTVFPNPGRDMFYLVSKQPVTKLTVVDMLGNIVYTSASAAPPGTSISLNLGNVPTGVYNLFVVYHGSTEAKKIVLIK
jgi:Secretion system C-terminal sorting domain